VGLERGPFRLVSTIEELLERESSGSGQGKKQKLRQWGSVTLTMWQSLSAKDGTNFADKGGRSVGIVRSRTQNTELFVLWF
jgi:hypothetical protein